MHVIADKDFNLAYPIAVKMAMDSNSHANPRGTRTKEIMHAVINVEDPTRHLVTSIGRPVNVSFALAEVIWILSGRNDVAFLEPFNSRIASFSDDGETFNAAYGYRLREEFGFDQIDDVFRTLTEDPDSRQAILQTWSPREDRGHELDDRGAVVPRQTKDRACNTQSQLLVRDGKLHWMQLQRSNDLIWGTPYNYMQFSHLHKWIALLLGYEVGEYTHVVNSLHIYDDYWEEAANIRTFDLYSELMLAQLDWDWGKPHEDLLETMCAEIDEMALKPLEHDHQSLKGDLPAYWYSALNVIHAHLLYREGEDQRAFNMLVDNSTHPVYGAAQLRLFWTNRWGRWSRADNRVIEEALERCYPPRVKDWITGEL